MTKATLASKEEELTFRKERAKKGIFSIEAMEPAFFPFADFEVKSESNIGYIVEIRSLSHPKNSCSCPDFQVNTLGTCKHIERVLYFLKKKLKAKSFSDHSKQGSNRIELFLDSFTKEPQLLWPTKLSPEQEQLKTVLSPFLSSSCTKVTDPINGIPCIQELVDESSQQMRISTHLLHSLKEQRNKQQRKEAEKQFLADVQAGKRSLQMLSAKLLPYQETGMLHLAFKGKAILADEMGLGKTIQAIAACELLFRLGKIKRVLVVSPASLKGEWDEQIQRFSGRSTSIVQGTRPQRLRTLKSDSFFFLMNYEQVRNDVEEIMERLQPDVLILDEAQRIKNWETKTATAVKRLKTPYAFVLTGTPIENRIEELYSIMQVVDPEVLGPLFQFYSDFYAFDEKGKPIEYKNIFELQDRLADVILRRTKKEVEDQLPERTFNTYFVPMDGEQFPYYDNYEAQAKKLASIAKKRPLTKEELEKLHTNLACMRMVADTPYIIDQTCRVCPKLEELDEILKGLLENPENKIILFSEWERMLQLVREWAKEKGVEFSWHTGSVPQHKRREEINRFKEDPTCRLFLSTDSGSTGLNLQVANVVINLDLPWNPAKLEQRIARAWRKNQTRVVHVINLVTEESIEHRMLSVLQQKQVLANAVLDEIGKIDTLPLSTSATKEMLRMFGDLGMDWFLEEEELQTKKDLPSFTQDLQGRYTDRLHLLEEVGETLLLVVDEKDDALLQQVSKTSPKPVEVLDLATYQLLQNLREKGVIDFEEVAQQPLIESALVKTKRTAHRKEKEALAKKVVSEAKRKYEMAKLLLSGGFVEEALPPAQESLQIVLQAYDILSLKPTWEENIEPMKGQSQPLIELLHFGIQEILQILEDSL